MLLQIDHHNGVPIYRQIMDQIRRLVMAGQLREGDRLLSVRQLSTQLRVNPMTVSKAYSLLEAENVLERRRGIGLFVNRIRSDQRAEARVALLEEQIRQTVALAVQFDVPPGEVMALIEQEMSQYGETIHESSE